MKRKLIICGGFITHLSEGNRDTGSLSTIRIFAVKPIYKYMKKLLLLLMLVLSTSTAFSQNAWFRATEFAYKYVEDGYWTNWSDWIDCNVRIKIDVTNDKIIIYSEDTQVYNVLNQESAPYDDNGEQLRFRVIDQDYDYGYVRLRLQNNGNKQLYVDFNNISWVYNIVSY